MFIYICSKCGKVITLSDICDSSFGNNGTWFCPECTNIAKAIKDEVSQRFDNPTYDMSARYISTVAWGVDPAGQMFTEYFDNNFLLRRRIS